MPAVSMERVLIVVAGVLGLTAVALGAFGAHGLGGVLDGVADAAQRLDWWRTGAEYHLAHALAVGLCAWLVARGSARAGSVAGLCFTVGVLGFSGTLYAMALGAPRWLGAVTPLGGLAFMVGWVVVIVAGVRAVRPRV